MAKKKKSEKADEIIKNHVWFSTIPGWLPIPRGCLKRPTAFFASQFYFFDGCFLEKNFVFL
jgi:hypothetical protein